jgi:hypothetical protein
MDCWVVFTINPLGGTAFGTLAVQSTVSLIKIRFQNSTLIRPQTILLFREDVEYDFRSYSINFRVGF